MNNHRCRGAFGVRPSGGPLCNGSGYINPNSSQSGEAEQEQMMVSAIYMLTLVALEFPKAFVARLDDGRLHVVLILSGLSWRCSY